MRTVSANERGRCICNVFCHWLFKFTNNIQNGYPCPNRTHYWTFWCLFRYLIRCLITISCKVSILEFEIKQSSQQHCYRQSDFKGIGQLELSVSRLRDSQNIARLFYKISKRPWHYAVVTKLCRVETSKKSTLMVQRKQYSNINSTALDVLAPYVAMSSVTMVMILQGILILVVFFRQERIKRPPPSVPMSIKC